MLGLVKGKTTLRIVTGLTKRRSLFLAHQLVPRFACSHGSTRSKDG